MDFTTNLSIQSLKNEKREQIEKVNAFPLDKKLKTLGFLFFLQELESD